MPERVASWVAESGGRVVGLTGLLDRGTSGEVEPVVVTDLFRGRRIGRLLIERVAAEAAAPRLCVPGDPARHEGVRNIRALPVRTTI